MDTVATAGSIYRRSFIAAAAVALTATQLGPYAFAQSGMPPFAGAIGWINSAPLTPAELRGKVVFVQFWTYTCINWLRAHPYVRAWAEKYKDQGLVVIGVHTPEFPFERDAENVRRAVQDMKIGYPVAIDSDYAIWRAFKNNYWPAFYVVDAQGRIRHQQFGEGEYEKSERMIQRLLEEAGASGVSRDLVSPNGQGAEAAADWGNLRSPESYVGYDSTENFSSGSAVLGKTRTYAAPARLSLNHWALAGDWTLERGLAASIAPGGHLAFRFHARDLHLVMGASALNKPVRFRVTIDGAAPAASHGLDIDAEGWGSVREPRLYQLVRQSGAIADRTFEIEFMDAGARTYCFTFG